MVKSQNRFGKSVSLFIFELIWDESEMDKNEKRLCEKPPREEMSDSKWTKCGQRNRGRRGTNKTQQQRDAKEEEEPTDEEVHKEPQNEDEEENYAEDDDEDQRERRQTKTRLRRMRRDQ